MFKRKSVKSVIILFAAVMMLSVVMLSACSTGSFTPVKMPDKSSVMDDSNGGNAVRYGDWIYYVNGYQSSNSAENTYVDVEARVGAIVRIKIADLEDLFSVDGDSVYTSSTAKTNEVAKRLKEYAEVVVPNFYYSSNTSVTQLNGLYIFNDRLYITTPNDELTAGGNTQTSQIVLTSYKLDGSDRTRHHVFTSSSAQIMLDEIDGKLLAMYVMDSTIGCIEVATDKTVVNIESVSNTNFDIADKSVFYTDEDGAICKYHIGETEGKVVVACEKEEGEDHSHVTYSITSVNGGNVYYTRSDSNNSLTNGIYLYYANETVSNQVAWIGKPSDISSYYGYKSTIVYIDSEDAQGTTLYGVYVMNDKEGTTRKTILDPINHDTSVTFDRLVGDKLYYTSDSVAYYVDLSATTPEPVAYARSLSSVSGWSVPDVLGEYVITLGSGSVSAVKFDKDTKTNSASVVLTKVVSDKD